MTQFLYCDINAAGISKSACACKLSKGHPLISVLRVNLFNL